MFLRYLNRTRKTIGFQLTLWYFAIFILSSLIFFVLIYFFLSISLQQRDKEVIQAELEDYLTKYQKGGNDALLKEMEENKKEMEENKFKKTVSGEDYFFVRLAGPENNTIFLYIPEEQGKFDFKQFENRGTKGNGQWLNLSSKDDKVTYEILSHRLANDFILQVGKAITKRKEFLEQFRAIFAAIIIPVIFLGFTGGAFFSFRALRPIHYLINTIRLIIDTGEMESRMPTRKRGDELDELSILFNRMLEKIEILMKGMREGLDNVAHDLRTPMTRLKGVAEIALQSDQDIVVLRETLSDCLEESERILTMLNTLMDVSEAETGVMKLNLEEVNIANLIEEVVDLYHYVAEEKNISIHTTLPKELYLTADRNRLRQVMANLLDNAIKYTHNRGRVDIETLQKQQEIVVTIKDTGIGIPAEELPRIWDRLYRGDKSRQQRGLGLGLTLIKAIVQAHKGYIEASSEQNVGSLFVIHIPQRL
jgi:signal transduction histidine kinase